ncbi:MAG TPA: TonB-dependent receptor plug domain-containing protein, partial [Acidobacteriaceae bacterium]|nr:TonB-dependent receptor plug domain-containing protein [Acidobacteriaceae bacterium]
VVNVEAAPDLLEKDPTFHTDVDRSTIDRLPVEGSSELSSIVTMTSPGVSADSNGLLHGLGDHAENTFSVDGQPISDQQSKVFSNQVPAAAVQSLEVIGGAPPAEYGDKTSLVINVTTRSGQGVTKPTGSVTASYGSFGSSNVAADLAYGGKNWGNFITVTGQQSGRFLDAPEFAVMHDKGNEENVFDRVDFDLGPNSSLRTNLQYTRSWFQTPNTYDTQYNFASQGLTAGATDQRSKIETFDIAPTFTHTLSPSAVLTVGTYVRRDGYNYNPSRDPLNDFGPIQQESVGQFRSLTNAGVHSDVSFTRGINSVKVGGLYQQTFLRENLQVGVVDPGLNDPMNGVANYSPVLAPYDLTRGGSFYAWHGQTDVKQLAFYGEDTITAGNWLINAGMRGDIYNGLSVQRQAEPRVGVSYNVKKTGTVLRVSYARTQETPFNENLVLSATGCNDAVLNAIFSTVGPCLPAPFNPGFRNEAHAGLQQGIGKRFVLSGEYIWKYTHNAYDFSVLGATPITFPIEWHNSKIPGFAVTGTLTEIRGLSAQVSLSSVAARFFNPQVGGVGSTIATAGGYPFRIDHDERFNQTTHLEYKLPFRKSMYYAWNWRFDSGQVAGAVPCYNTTDPNSICGPSSLTINGQPGLNLSTLTPDEEFQAGLVCNGVKATPTTGFTQCLASQLTSALVKIPAPNTEDDDRNPQRIAPRNLFDMALGDDDVVHWRADRFKIGARVTAINVTDKYALYNFLSTFSGTHYVSPRTVTAEVAFHF